VNEIRVREPLEWVQAVILHVRDTGHTELLPSDDPLRLEVGCFCAQCETQWCVPIRAIKAMDSLEGRLTKPHMTTVEGRRALLSAWVAQGLEIRNRPASEPPASAWDRLVGPDLLD
jgi:hypothetical protein